MFEDFTEDELRTMRSALLVAEAGARTRAMRAQQGGTEKSVRNAVSDFERFSRVRLKLEQSTGITAK